MKLIIDETITYGTVVENRITNLIVTPFYTEDAVTEADTNAIGISYVIGNGVEDIAAGWVLFDQIKANITITSIALLADQSGSIVIDLWKDSLANYPPTSADSICATSKPTITTATNSVQTVFVGWDVTWEAGEILGINVDSATSVKQVTISIIGTRTPS